MERDLNDLAIKVAANAPSDGHYTFNDVVAVCLGLSALMIAFFHFTIRLFERMAQRVVILVFGFLLPVQPASDVNMRN